jgi:methylated-DNA-[protein]-cysteine S-methyltransferase
MMTTHKESLEARLCGSEAALNRAFIATRARFAERALTDGLVDIAYEDHDTPLGPVRLVATQAGIVRVGLPAENPEDLLERLARRISPRILHAHRPILTRARRQLDEYFAGRRREFGVALDWSLTGRFRRRVLQATAQIPYGTTSTYRQVAADAGSPRAVRAAGSALASNPLTILVPCHRVLRSDGGLGQYRGGAAVKAQLLHLENAS